MKPIRSTFTGIIFSLVSVLANFRALMFFPMDPDTSYLLAPAWIEIFAWLLPVILVGYMIIQENQRDEYFSAWKRNWLLGMFIFLAFLSAFWSIDPSATMFRALEILFAALIASYIGLRHRPGQLMQVLFWFGAVMLILSVGLVFGAPNTGVMYWAPFNGAWRGVYWHRNHLSSIAALVNVVFLCRAIISAESRNRDGILDAIFYLFSLVVIYNTRSATGYILSIILHFVVISSWGWIRLHHRLQRRHYYFAFGLFALGLTVVLTNLDFVFGLFNRTTTLTGRVGLWEYILNIVSQKPWLGHGFGAVWMLDTFREDVRLHIGWASQPLIGDNGFIDILLHLGIVGLMMFAGLLVTAFIRAIKYAVSRKTLADFFPLIFLIYVVIANIPFSLFAETEVFVWFLIVAVLFMTQPPLNAMGKQTTS